MRTLNREEWDAFCHELQGSEEGDFRVEARISDSHGSLEFHDYEKGVSSDINAYVSVAATDLRCGQVQLIVGKKRGALIVSHPPYPISRWTVLWEGEFFPKTIENELQALVR